MCWLDGGSKGHRGNLKIFSPLLLPITLEQNMFFFSGMYLLQEIIITELGFAKHELIQLQTSARRARVM